MIRRWMKVSQAVGQLAAGHGSMRNHCRIFGQYERLVTMKVCLCHLICEWSSPPDVALGHEGSDIQLARSIRKVA